MPNLMQIVSIFLKLQAVKQSGPGFLANTLFAIYSPHDVDKFANCASNGTSMHEEKELSMEPYPLG